MIKIGFKYIPLIIFFFVTTGFAKAQYLREDDLRSLVVSCYLDNEVTVFCSKQQIDNPHLKLYLPLFKSSATTSVNVPPISIPTANSVILSQYLF